MPDPRIFPITRVIDTYATCGVASTELVAANKNRLGCDIINDSKQIIYIARGNDAVIGSGVRLNTEGGSYRIGTSNLWEGAINGICAGGQANVCISEEVKP